MAKLIREHSTEVKDEDATYIVRIYGEERTDGTETSPGQAVG